MNRRDLGKKLGQWIEAHDAPFYAMAVTTRSGMPLDEAGPVR